MRTDDYTITQSHEELQRALARLVRDQQRRPAEISTVSRLARAVRYLEPALIPVAGGVWVYNAWAVVAR